MASKTANDDQETGHEFHVAFWTAKSANPLKLTKAGRLPLDQSSPAEFSHGLPKFRDNLGITEFSGEFLSQKSLAKAKVSRLTFATVEAAGIDPLQSFLTSTVDVLV